MCEYKELIKRLWEGGMTAREIISSIPMKPYRTTKLIKQMKKSGELVGNSGKTKAKTIAKVKMLYESGLNRREIANELNLSVRVVGTYLLSAGVRTGKPKHNYGELCEKTNQILADISLGEMKVKDIAKKYGVTKQYVYNCRVDFADILEKKENNYDTN